MISTHLIVSNITTTFCLVIFHFVMDRNGEAEPAQNVQQNRSSTSNSDDFVHRISAGVNELRCQHWGYDVVLIANSEEIHATDSSWQPIHHTSKPCFGAQ
uniref:Uncharacterized protein n=1 Tax=Trichobilharzia regenti TaxID=157069 RepID=A0AA85J8L2_TRIRE|nr:unnamed protein product [Trichobilharzia regenti]